MSDDPFSSSRVLQASQTWTPPPRPTRRRSRWRLVGHHCAACAVLWFSGSLADAPSSVSIASIGAEKLKARFENIAKASDEENRKRAEEERARRQARDSRERELARRRQEVGPHRPHVDTFPSVEGRSGLE